MIGEALQALHRYCDSGSLDDFADVRRRIKVIRKTQPGAAHSLNFLAVEIARIKLGHQEETG